jgi:hypothetical protein
MSNLIRSTEFGDWLIAELSSAVKRSKNVAPAGAPTSSALELEDLRVAKKILRKFMTLQHKMLNAASERRNC